MNRFSRYAALGLLGTFALPAHAGVDEPAATPYRPSVSTPAALPVPGWLDMEFGWQRTKGGGDRYRESLPVSAKLAFDNDWGVVLGSELQVRRTDLDQQVFSGGGDTTLLLKRRFATADEGTAWGLMVGFKSPTAKDTIGSGKSDAILTGIYSSDLPGENHLDINLGATRLGAYGEGEARTQYGWAAALSHNLDETWSVFAEPSGIYRRGTPATTQFIVGASYAYSKRTVFDLAMATGLTKAAPDWQIMVGVTVLVGRLW